MTALVGRQRPVPDPATLPRCECGREPSVMFYPTATGLFGIGCLHCGVVFNETHQSGAIVVDDAEAAWLEHCGRKGVAS